MADAGQQALLRRFEPILRHTQGEHFFPMDAEAYIRACSLWLYRRHEGPRQIVAASELTPELLAEAYDDVPGDTRYLQFTEPLKATEMAARALRRPRGLGHADFSVGLGRLARVGYLSRIMDALFSVALLARGRVPGDAATAARIGYRALTRDGVAPVYHGRVVEESGWIVLQYWYFYLYNDWRSSFNGANDHEADWEMACIYLAKDQDGALHPEWVAYAAHDYEGDDLRRRWDDPELQLVGEHPVIYVGAGSHASYFQPGEYLTEIELRIFAPGARLISVARTWWRRLQGDKTAQQEELTAAPADDLAGQASVLAIPFVDYARGDGLTIGPAQQLPWDEPHLIDDDTGWVHAYRGLWGLYTQDPFAGEDAPAGPMYNRDGAVRRAWYDPVGWAGLDKVTPVTQLADVIDVRQQVVRAQRDERREAVRARTTLLRGLGVQVAATTDQPQLAAAHVAAQQSIRQLSHEINELQAGIVADGALLAALERSAAQVRAGDYGSPRAHIRRAHRPAAPVDLRASYVAEFWAAISVTALLVAFVVLFAFRPSYLPLWLVVILALFLFIEASMRGTVNRLLSSLTGALAIVAALILLYRYFWWVVGGVVLAMALYILWDNLSELLRARRRTQEKHQGESVHH
jgi:hypothetical protein